jgi:ribosome-binding protein aMBF1 (putative translation factor)
MAPSPPKLRANNVGRKRTRPEYGKKPSLSQRFTLHLYDAVERSGLSNAEIAQKVGVSPDTVAKWLRGENVPSLDYWDKLSLALGFSDRTELVDF